MLRRTEHRLLAWLMQRAKARGELETLAPLGVMSRNDALTGLLNRSAFIEVIRRLRREGTPGVVLLIDVDLFKPVNDRYGHSAGDVLLCTLASRLRERLPAIAVLGRFGGDEFIAFAPAPSLDAGSRLAEGLLAVLREPITLAQGQTVHVTASIGLTSLERAVDVEKTLSAADQALHAAKQAGRDRVQVFDDETKGLLGERRSLAATVARLQDSNQALRRLAETDALTGLGNRAALDRLLPKLCGSEGEWPECAVAFLDIDHFGSFNKLHGDPQGDAVLQRVAQTVRGSARSDDLVFRKGGEELVVVLPHASHEQARVAAERMRAAVEALNIPHAGSPTAPVVTVTVGIASVLRDRTVTVNELMAAAAHMAMQAKVQSTRNRVHVAQRV